MWHKNIVQLCAWYFLETSQIFYNDNQSGFLLFSLVFWCIPGFATWIAPVISFRSCLVMAPCRLIENGQPLKWFTRKGLLEKSTYTKDLGFYFSHMKFTHFTLLNTSNHFLKLKFILQIHLGWPGERSWTLSKWVKSFAHSLAQNQYWNTYDRNKTHCNSVNIALWYLIVLTVCA